jgi:hypothetical protein
MLLSESFVPLNEFERQLFTRLVPEDHYLRQLERFVGFERFRPILAEYYAPREGRLTGVAVNLKRVVKLRTQRPNPRRTETVRAELAASA